MKLITFLCTILFCFNGFAQVHDKNINTPEAALKLSKKYSEKASWFTKMPQFNSDSALYYADKSFKMLNPMVPLHQAKLRRLQFERMKKNNSTYSISIQDSLAQIGWDKIKKLNDGNDYNRMLCFDYLVYWSDLKLRKGDRATSIDLFSQALAKMEKTDQPDIKAKINLHKGLYYAKYGLPEEKKFSLKYLHNSLNYYKNIDVDKNPGELYMIYAELIYQHTGNNQDSVYFYYDRVKSVLTNYKKPLAHIWYYTMFSYELIQQAKSNKKNTQLNKYKEAKQNVLKATEIMETYNMKTNSYYPYSFALLGDIDFYAKNYTMALEYYKKAYASYINLNDYYHATSTLNSIGETYKELGDFAMALNYKEQFYNESLKFEKEKNERSLRENELQLDIVSNEKSLARKNNQQIMLLIIISIGLILIGFIYHNYKLKQTSNLKLEKVNQELNTKNQQNELLLKEIHHRVKNNLELVKSLISLQSAQLEDSDTKDAMIASQNRVQSMGIIHQKLYQGENLGSIEMKDYFLNLGEGILDTFNADDKVKIECAMDQLELDVDTAVPIGLIVNELLTNALKYAFPENSKGNISISLSKSNPETLTLKVVDNGIGKTAGLAPKGTGFGSQLIKLLTQQLNGKMTEENQNGTSVLFHFKLQAACILLLFCFQLSFAQKPTKSLDSVVNWVTTNVTVYKDSTIAYQKAHKTLKAVLKHGDTSLIAQSYANLANWHSYHFYIFKTPDSVLYYDKKALELYVSLKDTVKSIEAHGNITLDYISRKQYNLAEKEAFKTIALCKASKNELSLALNYINLADIYTLTHNTASAVQYADKGILLIKKLNNKEELGFAYSATIETYLQNKDYKKVLHQSNETIRIFKELGIGDNDILKAYNGRGSAYKHLGENDKALKDFLYVLTEAKKLYGDAIGGGYAHYVGETYMAQQNYEAALPYLNEGVAYAITFNEPNFLLRRYEALSNCLKHLNRYAEALKYSGLAEVLKDSMHNETIKSLQSELLVKYETAQKDETITAQDSQIAQQRKTQLLYVGIAVLLGLGLVGMYFSLKNISKKRKILQVLHNELDSKNQQNELLLKEIHHRVKNNLELVKSLIALQSAQLEDSDTKDAMIASQNRVQSMGIIHQKLYQGENLGSIEMKDYFLNLGEGILDTFNADDKVKIECAMDQLELDVDTAVPIGLIVNELLTNALKYAFPENSKGNISISLSKSNPETLTLKVVDNGIGKTAGLAPKGTGFGSQLIKLLTQQLNGKMTEENQNGTSVLFHFKLNTAA